MAALVQPVVSNSASATTVTVTLGSPTTAGNCLIVLIGSTGTSTNGSVSGVTLGGAADNFAALATQGSGGDHAIVAAWADPNCAGGQTSVVVSTTGSAGTERLFAWAFEFSGIVTSGLLDQSATFSSSGFAGSWGAGPTGTTTQANEVWFGIVCGNANSGSSTFVGPSSPWINETEQFISPEAQALCGYQIVSSTGTATYSGTASPTSTADALVITVKATASAPPDVPQADPGPTWLRLFKPWAQRPRPVPPALQAISVTGGLSLAPLAFTAQSAQTSPDIPSITPGPAWFRWFKPQWSKPVPPIPAAQAVSASGGISLAPLTLAGTGAQTSPDLPQVNPGSFWLRLFKPGLPRPAPPTPATPAISATGSLSLGALVFAATGTQTSPDVPQVQPGPAWFRLFKPWAQRPVPPIPAAQNVNLSGALALAPLALTATGAQTSPDVPQAIPGPVWQRLFKPWLARPVPPIPATPTVNATGGIALAPLAIAAAGAQTSPDVPGIQPGLSWFRLFKPWAPRPVPPLPALQNVSATGGVALGPLTFTAAGAQTSPDQPQVQPGPAWFRLFKPWIRRPVPPPPASTGITASGGLTLAPLAFTGQGAQTSPDVPSVQPGPTWFGLFKPWAQRPRPVPPPPPSLTCTGGLTLAPLTLAGTGASTSPDIPQAAPGPFWFRLFKPWIQRPQPVPPASTGITASGGLTLAPLTLAAQAAQTSPDIPSIQPGPVWYRLFRPWAQRPAPIPPAMQAVSATGGLTLAPLALAGTGAQTSPDVRQIQPGPAWLRLFRPWLAPKVPPVPATPAVNATGGLTLAPLALSGTGAVTGSVNSDQPQLQPGPFWLRIFKPWIQRPAPATAGQGGVTITASGGLALAPLAMSGTASTPSPLFTATGARWKWGTAGSRWKWGTSGARNQ